MVSVRIVTRIRRDPAAVFDYFADLRNEPVWNRGHVRDTVMTSAPPIGLGTTFEGRHSWIGRATWRLSEYDRPHHLMIDGVVGRGTYVFVCDLSATADGCELRSRVDWGPAGLVALLAPLLRPLLQFQARRSFNRLRRVLEG